MDTVRLPTVACAFCTAHQAAFCRISCAVFGHLLALDLNFHVHRKTGQIMRILDRGTSSIQVGGAKHLPLTQEPCRAVVSARTPALSAVQAGAQIPAVAAAVHAVDLHAGMESYSLTQPGCCMEVSVMVYVLAVYLGLMPHDTPTVCMMCVLAAGLCLPHEFTIFHSVSL